MFIWKSIIAIQQSEAKSLSVIWKRSNTKPTNSRFQHSKTSKSKFRECICIDMKIQKRKKKTRKALLRRNKTPLSQFGTHLFFVVFAKRVWAANLFGCSWLWNMIIFSGSGKYRCFSDWEDHKCNVANTYPPAYLPTYLAQYILFQKFSTSRIILKIIGKRFNYKFYDSISKIFYICIFYDVTL